ncbi:ABC transporter permease [Actinoplanes subtropicus]|uniref:ABC transporter permease n=1 Tax=Actinoplanes subtropicus TaxID=543632 RepID=UPI0004C2E4A7|nr:ABC transporter permease [Actinoplanes subtropicus]
MSRVFRIELRRSAAPGSALILLVAGALLLFLVDRPAFTTGWIQLAMTQRLYLAVLWPLALAAGAWQARREHRSNVAELFASTPRPRVQRTVPTLGAMALAVVAGYLAMGLAGAGWIAGTARYLPASVFAVVAVGLLALVAAVWLGLAAGRLLPSPATAPALGIAGLGLLLLIPSATRPHGWLALVFSPIYEMNLPDAYTTVPGPASVAQAIWLAALAITAVLLFASGGWRLRVAALLPVVLGAALAIAVMPRDNRYVIDAVDPVARELVCVPGDPRVCVSRVHSGLLAEVAAPAREALTVLARLPSPPTQVHEDTATYLPAVHPPWHDHVVLLRVEAGPDGHLADRGGVVAAVVAGAFASRGDCDHFAQPDERFAAAYWLLGRQPAEPGDAQRLWQDLQQKPDAEARVVALRRAALSCTVQDGQLTR